MKKDAFDTPYRGIERFQRHPSEPDIITEARLKHAKLARIDLENFHVDFDRARDACRATVAYDDRYAASYSQSAASMPRQPAICLPT